MSEASLEYREFERVAVCPVCRAEDRRTVDPEASVVECRDCGHRYVDPRPTQSDIAAGYSRPSAYDDWLREAEVREILWRRRVNRVLGDRQPGSLLDVGAGLGTFLAMARDRGWTVSGTEVSSTAIDYAQRTYGLGLARGFLEDAGYLGPFDVITLWHVIEHVPDPVATLQECRRLLGANGRLVLGLPNDGRSAQQISELMRAVRRAVGRPVHPRYERLRPGIESHLSHFSPGTIALALKRAGFEVVEQGVDDAAVWRSRLGRVAFAARSVGTRLTGRNLGREMLVIARPRSRSGMRE